MVKETDRLEKVRKVINGILCHQGDAYRMTVGFSHLYGVALFCSILAKKRGLNIELATIAGMLHDIWTCQTGSAEDHASLGAAEAKKLLIQADCFDDMEMDQICNAIKNHSSKKSINADLDELLKDADVLHHYFYNTTLSGFEHERDRLKKVLEELHLEN